MRMLRMEMGGKMGKRMGERKSIGSFYMRVGIFVSMYFTLLFFLVLFKREEIKKTIQQSPPFFFLYLKKS